ncbi:hypothetical protein [Neobacillus drentensis]|uniref:hypothetical protein n=1 Tax=Neobacillus drentensis TaxID=220684 RepID=UPI002FFEEF72
MTELKRKRKGWRWLLGAVVLIVVLFIGLQYTKLAPQTFFQNLVTQGNNFIKTTVEQIFVPSSLESIVAPLSGMLGICAADFSLYSILFVSITLAALLVGWYLRKFGKNKWLGYLLSFIGFLPILPIMFAGSLVNWLGKQYWKSGKAHSKKGKKSSNYEGSNPPPTVEGLGTSI